MKRNILFILSLMVTILSFGQNITYFPADKVIWQSPTVGQPLYKVEILNNSNRVYFYFDDKEYDYVSSSGSAFFERSDADTFFNKCLYLLNYPYQEGEYLTFTMNGLYVRRLDDSFGFPILIIYDDKAWTIIGKSKIKSIIKSLKNN